jgi:hypothetical protein
MNSPTIPPDVLNRFRHAASQYALTARSRASRLPALKDDIAALRKRGVSYRAISELLTQSGITASDTCVMNFCHRVLKERRRNSSVTQRARSNANPHVARKTAPDVTVKTTLPSVPATTDWRFAGGARERAGENTRPAHRQIRTS